MSVQESPTLRIGRPAGPLKGRVIPTPKASQDGPLWEPGGTFVGVQAVSRYPRPAFAMYRKPPKGERKLAVGSKEVTNVELYERIVQAHLLKDPWVFVRPQYSIQGDSGEWSCPDFVALDFKLRHVVIVEVSTAANPKSLRVKVSDRENQWVHRLRSQLSINKVIDQQWDFAVRLYIREVAEAKMRTACAGSGTPVEIFLLEKLGSAWQW